MSHLPGIPEAFRGRTLGLPDDYEVVYQSRAEARAERQRRAADRSRNTHGSSE